MAGDSEAKRLQELEARLAALEGSKSDGGDTPQSASPPESTPSEGQAALIQAFLQGALVGNSVGASAPAQSGDGGAAPQFLSIFGCPPKGGGGGGGWSPTNYDSIFWCKSRFMCNPASISCLC